MARGNTASRVCWAVAVFAAGALTTFAAAQSVPSSPRPTGPELKQRPEPPAPTGKIKLDVVVTDKKGKPISGLDEKDFTLLDNRAPARIVSLTAVESNGEGGSVPAQAIILLDAVNIGYLTLVQTRDEVAKFLRKGGGHLPLPVSLFLFTDDGATELAAPSTDGNELAAELDKTKATFRTIGRSGGTSGASERWNSSIEWLLKIATDVSRHPGRKLLIWAGPGWPILTDATIHTSPQGQRLLFDHAVDVSTTLREAQVAVYSVSMSNPSTDTSPLNSNDYESFLKGVKSVEQIKSGDMALKVIATQSGGQVMGPDNDLAGQIRSCILDATAFYRLSFDPPHTEKTDEYHDLKVMVDKPKAAVRTNTGYYNQP